MSINKFALAMLITSALSSTSVVRAQDGQITFTGAVGAATCTAVVMYDGVPLPAGNVLNFGRIHQGTGTSVRSFEIVLLQGFPTPNSPTTVCTNVAPNGARITWSGNLGAKGFENQLVGGADDAFVELAPTVDGRTKGNLITNHNPFADFAAAEFSTTEGAEFIATFTAGTDEGAFSSAASFVTSYL
ncbi:hypothetical protein [Vibrio jasicida]|uniref:hypothetical protein n=1 Tax=Vibrio jasicida TaxID=766224 RepID=UPI000AEE06F0